jgi:hypothetical protein
MDEIFSLCGESDVRKVYADIPTAEFRTKNGTLSTWYIDSLDDIENAILAIAVSSSEITKMDFIIINIEILLANALEYKQTYAGQDIAIPDLQNTHYDILDITVEKLANCTRVYQTIANMDPDRETYIIRYAAGQIKDLLKRAIKDERIDESKATPKIKEQLNKLKVSQ